MNWLMHHINLFGIEPDLDVSAGSDGIRLIRAFSQIEQSRRKNLLTQVESLVPVKRTKASG